MAMRDRVKELRRVKASEIVGAPWNWRTHPPAQVEALAGSIEELGFFDPLDTRELPDGRLQLIDGHARRDFIDSRIGPDTIIPCVVTDFTEDEAKKANLLKDPLAAMAEADARRLDSLLKDVAVASSPLQSMLSELAAANPTQGETEIRSLDVRPPPKMSWVLIGIPTVRFGEIAADMERLASVPGILIETTSNDGPDEENG